MTTSSSAPSGSILSQPDFSSPAFNGSRDFSDNAGPPGQVFRALSSFDLQGVTVKGIGNWSGTGAALGNFVLTIGIVEPDGTLTRLAQETASAAGITNATDYITMTLDTPVPLQKDRQYAYTIHSTAGWFGFAKSSADVLFDSFAMQAGTTARTHNSGAPVVNFQGVDRTFFLSAAVPEPGTITLFGLAGLALAGRRRRQQA